MNMNDSASSSNITADELDDETKKKLRGDAIGNTMYSEVFVLNTLLQFSDLKWSDEIEDKLCFLWDMTEEKDICEYLFKASYTTLACTAIEKYNEPRFIEIVVGIFANLLCSECDKKIEDAESKVVLNLLNSNDPYILIQVMRYIRAISNICEKLEVIEAEHLARFDFILNNSTNKELLTITLKTLATITNDRKINHSVLQGELLLSTVTGYRSLNDETKSWNENFESQEMHMNMRYLIEFLCNMCSYIDVLQVKDFIPALNSHIDEFNNEIIIPLLNYYKIVDNLLPIDEQFRFYIEALTYIYKVLRVNYISLIARSVYEIFYILYKNDLSNMQLVLEMLCYFITIGNLDQSREDFQTLSYLDIKKALCFIVKNSNNFELEYTNTIKMILEEL